MGFYDNPLVIRGDSQEELRSGGNQLYTRNELLALSEKYDMYNGDDGNNPYLKQLNYQNPNYAIRANSGGSDNFYTDPNTGNIYTNKEYDFANGEIRYTPYLNVEDIQSDEFLPYLAQKAFTSPEDLKSLVDLKNSNPKEYAKQAAAGIADMAFNLWQGNSPYVGELFSQLEKFKETNPEAYYAADFALKAKQMGHHAANGAENQNATYTQDIQNNYANAIKAGLSPEFINQTINENYSATAADRAKTNAVNAASGGGGFNFKTDMLPGLMLVGGALAGAYGIDSALAAGAAASASGAGGAAGAGALDSTAIALGGSGGGGAFVPAAGSGASFGIVPGAAYTTAGLGSNAGLMGPTYGELGYTGVEGGFAGPTYQELGYTGLNQSEAIAAADAASKGLTGADALKYINNAKKAYDTTNTLSKLLGGSGNTAGVKNATGTASNAANYNPQQMASLLGSSLPTQAAPGGLYKMNENPFNFGTQGQTVATPGTYDVSGTNPMANTLRNYKV
jgi:hypothetical protein